MVNHISILLIGYKNKKATINPINKKDKCFQYTVTVAVNHEKIKKVSAKNNKKLNLL